MRRSPRVLSDFGAYPSRASTEPSSGNPLKAVFAARRSTSAVAACMTKKRIELLPNIAEATCAIRLRCGSVGAAVPPLRLHGVLGWWDGWNSVGDRVDTGEGGASTRKRTQQKQHNGTLGDGLGLDIEASRFGDRSTAECQRDEADHNHEEHAADKQVGGQSKRFT